MRGYFSDDEICIKRRGDFKMMDLEKYFSKKEDAFYTNAKGEKKFRGVLKYYGDTLRNDEASKFRGETYYWEHVGRLDLPDYKAHWEIKEKWYEKHFPGKLLTTFEGKDLSTSAMSIIKQHM